MKILITRTDIDDASRMLTGTDSAITPTNILIKKQNYDELKIIMRSIFLSEKPKLTDYQDVIEQVRHLNKLVTLECSRIIMTNLEQHLSYLTDISKDLDVFDLGTATSIKGTKSAELFK